MRRRITLVAAIAGLVFGGGAHATSLGSISARSLLHRDFAALAPTPAVIGCDNFTGTSGTTMSNRAATVASTCASRVWTTHSGTWTLQSGTAAASTLLTSAVVTQNTTTSNSSVRATLTSLDVSGRSGGLVTSSSGEGATYLAAVLTAGTPHVAQLRMVTAGTTRVLASATPTITATNDLVLARSDSTVTVTLNGTTIITAALAAADVTSLGSSARTGLFSANSNVRFDDFVVTTP